MDGHGGGKLRTRSRRYDGHRFHPAQASREAAAHLLTFDDYLDNFHDLSSLQPLDPQPHSSN